MFRSLRHRMPRLGRWPRLCLAAICGLLALSSALSSAKGSTGSTGSVAVVVAAHDLPGGRTLTRTDLAVARWPPRLRPDGARGDPAGLTGRRLAGPVNAGEPLTLARVVGADLVRGLGPELVADPVLLDDPHTVDVVHAGDRVTVLETPRLADDGFTPPPAKSSGLEVVATHVLALAVLRGTDDSAAEVVLAVDRATAVRITRDRTVQTFTLVVDPP